MTREGYQLTELDYDTHYVATAKLLGCDLWTADESLLNALDGRLRYVKAIRHYPG